MIPCSFSRLNVPRLAGAILLAAAAFMPLSRVLQVQLAEQIRFMAFRILRSKHAEGGQHERKRLFCRNVRATA